MKIKIAIAEDHQLFRSGLISLLSSITDIEILFSSENGKIFLDDYEGQKVKPDICLIDLEMPEMNGMELCSALIKAESAAKMIMLSQYADQGTIGMMFEKGIHSYLTKNASVEELSKAIHAVYESGFYMDQQMLNGIRKSLISKPFADLDRLLSKREREILRLICLEYTNPEIAVKLFLSNRTVEGHRNNMLCKTGSKNTAGLVVFAIKNNIITLNEL